VQWALFVLSMAGVVAFGWLIVNETHKRRSPRIGRRDQRLELPHNRLFRSFQLRSRKLTLLK
jgi:hypothetical protein